MTSKVAFCLIILAGAIVGTARPTAAGAGVATIVYPPTPRSDAAETYFGTAVADPYRWMEQTQSPEVKRWVSLETELSEKNLARLLNRRDLRSLMLRIISAPVDYVPQRGTYATVFGRDRAGAAHTILDGNSQRTHVGAFRSLEAVA